MAKIIYLGAFLTEESKRALLTAFPPKHPTVHADHVTLAFDPSYPEVKEFVRFSDLEGALVDVEVTGYISDEKGEAVRVRFPEVDEDEQSDSPMFSRVGLHITISCAEGVKPVYSNELIARLGSLQPMKPPLSLTAVLDAFPRSKP